MPGPNIFTLGDLYKAFKSLENAHSYFADVLAGVHGAGFDYDEEIPLDADALEQLMWVIKGPYGGRVCDKPPHCNIPKGDYASLVGEYVVKSAAVDTALTALLERFNQPKIHYLAGSLPGWPYGGRGDTR